MCIAWITYHFCEAHHGVHTSSGSHCGQHLSPWTHPKSGKIKRIILKWRFWIESAMILTYVPWKYNEQTILHNEVIGYWSDSQSSIIFIHYLHVHHLVQCCVNNGVFVTSIHLRSPTFHFLRSFHRSLNSSNPSLPDISPWCLSREIIHSQTK